MIGSLILFLVLGPNLRQRFRRVYIGRCRRWMQQATGREFIWDFSEEAQQQRADRLVQLTLKENASAALEDLAGA